MHHQCAKYAQSSSVKCAHNAQDILVDKMQRRPMDVSWFKNRKKSLRITDADVSEALGVERSVANKVLNGRVAINPKRFDQMAALFQVSLDHMLFRLGISGQNPLAYNERCIKSSPEIMVWGKVATGVWMEENPVDPDKPFPKTVPYDQMAGDFGSEHLFAVEPEGESMNLTFMLGTILICRRVAFGVGTVESGDYVIVARKNHGLYEMTCKRIELDENEDFLLFSESSNPKYAEPIKIPKSTDFEFFDGDVTVVGVVIRQVRDMTRRKK